MSACKVQWVGRVPVIASKSIVIAESGGNGFLTAQEAAGTLT